MLLMVSCKGDECEMFVEMLKAAEAIGGIEAINTILLYLGDRLPQDVVAELKVIRSELEDVVAEAIAKYTPLSRIELAAMAMQQKQQEQQKQVMAK